MRTLAGNLVHVCFTAVDFVSDLGVFRYSREEISGQNLLLSRMVNQVVLNPYVLYRHSNEIIKTCSTKEPVCTKTIFLETCNEFGVQIQVFTLCKGQYMLHLVCHKSVLMSSMRALFFLSSFFKAAFAASRFAKSGSALRTVISVMLYIRGD